MVSFSLTTKLLILLFSKKPIVSQFLGVRCWDSVWGLVSELKLPTNPFKELIYQLTLLPVDADMCLASSLLVSTCCDKKQLLRKFWTSGKLWACPVVIQIGLFGRRRLKIEWELNRKILKKLHRIKNLSTTIILLSRRFLW